MSTLHVDVKINDEPITLPMVLSFVTGDREIPLGGFHIRPSLHLSTTGHGFMTVSTCSLGICFNSCHVDDYEWPLPSETRRVFNACKLRMLFLTDVTSLIID